MKKIILASLVCVMCFIVSMVSSITYATTTTLEIGDYVQFGEYYGAPIQWRVIHKDEEGNPLLF